MERCSSSIRSSLRWVGSQALIRNARSAFCGQPPRSRLEGGRRRGSGPPTAIHALVPEHAARALDRLIGRPRAGDSSYGDVASFAADLDADREKPTEVDAARRAAHLAPAALALALPLAWMFYVAYPRQIEFPNSWGYAVIAPALWVLWAALTRGGLLLGLAGLALVRSDSRPAERWRCAWRALIVWSPLTMLLVCACLSRQTLISTPAKVVSAMPWVLWGMAIAYALICPVLALIFPSRSLHDRLAGTALVPK